MGNEQEQHHAAINIKDMLDKAAVLLPPSNECCIYKVPHRLRKLNPEIYTPKIVSIGPFHHGTTQLQKMEGHKHTYCQKFIEISEASLGDLVNRVEELEPRVRRCYSEKINLTVEKFIEVIFVDCCFTLQFMSGDISMKPWLQMDIGGDLMLIENQLPFFVYHEIFELAFKSRIKSDRQLSFMKLASDWLPFVTIDEGAELPPIELISHLTDLHRHYCIQPSRKDLPKPPERGNSSLTHFHCATELKEAGVKFRVDKKSTRFIDLQVSGSYLIIPQFMVQDGTETILRNIIAFEQCHRPTNPYFTDFIEIIDFLINTEKDVDILVSNEIFINWLGDSKTVARMFNGIGKNVEVGNSNTNYLRIRDDLDAYCKHWWHRGKATLRRDYCNTRWKAVASGAAIVLLVLTITQTIFSILQVV